MSDAELLGILLQTGSLEQDAVSLAQSLLIARGGVAALNRGSISELTKTNGIGPAKASTIRAALELGRRAILTESVERVQVRSAQDVASLFEARLRGLDREQLYVVLLSSKNHVLKTCKIYEGNVSTSIVRPSEIFKEAIAENAPAIIIAHNHPSGDPTPSADDVRVTRDIVQAGKLLDVDVLDHLVIGDQRHGYVSLRERRLGFDPA